MADNVADVLERAADLIAAPGAWTQGAYARNKSGAEAEEYDAWPRGRLCFCALGAISRASGDRFVGQSNVNFARPLGFGLPLQVAQWNDAPERTQAEVVAKLREAAAKARAEQVQA